MNREEQHIHRAVVMHLRMRGVPGPGLEVWQLLRPAVVAA